ncbi:fungal-specific transcription factor domain-containing protein [Xylogone sp. PMI_703]|nr:fungal-specific transcription factor domain-containing protein [Xylogone sp. PMI_703]
MDLVDSKKKKRRIPPNLRRRALVSCDRCKQRRVRCIRPGETDESEEPCQNCVESGVKCESTLPRKQRIYGSVENLSVRYRVLDAIVRGLYPDRDTSDLETLFSIAEANNIPLPQTTGQSSNEHALFQPSSPVDRRATGVLDSPSAPSTGNDNVNPFESHPTRVVEEKLVPAPHGASHYIGPSSSFNFVVMVRNMVAEYNAASRTHEPNDEQVSLRADFVRLRASKALEPHAVSVEDQTGNQKRQDRYYLNAPGDVAQKKAKDAIRTFLPTRDVADALVEAYFDRVHPNYMIFHRGAFQIRYESLWADEKKPIQEFETGLICSVFMMFVFGAQALEHHDEQKSIQVQRRYLDLVQCRTYQLLHTTSLLNVQALLLLQLHQHNATERNTSWMLLGCASRMAVALGMHREGATGGFDSIEREVRRRVWWTIYIFEQNLCTILGRPSAIDDSEVTITLPKENILDGGDCVPPGYIDYALRLAKLTAEIKRKVYAASSNMTVAETPDTSIANHLLAKLESWNHSLPPYIQLEFLSPVPKQRRAVLLLHIQYHHAQSLITRPFILRKARILVARQSGKKVRSSELDTGELELSYACGTSARKVAVLLQQLATGGMFEGIAWIDAYYLYHCILVLSLEFLARPAGQRDTLEDAARKEAVRDVVDAIRNIKLCSTFKILTQVAMQLAKIVGIFDDATTDNYQEAEATGSRASQHQQIPATTDPRQQGDVDNMINQWFQNESMNHLPWDIFGDDNYGIFNDLYNPDMPMTSTLSGYVAPIEGDFTRRPFTGSPSIYPGWSSVEESYTQSNKSSSGGFSPTNNTKG